MPTQTKPYTARASADKGRRGGAGAVTLLVVLSGNLINWFSCFSSRRMVRRNPPSLPPPRLTQKVSARLIISSVSTVVAGQAGIREGGEGAQFMHSRYRVSIAIRPYNVRAKHVGFSSTRQALSAPSAKPREVFGESHDG